MTDNIIADLRFEVPVILWRGPSPFHFIRVPARFSVDLRDASREVSYGWGAVPAEATIQGCRFRTSLFPKDGSFLLPLKKAVREQTGIEVGDRVSVRITVRRPGGL